MGALIGLIIT